VIETEFDPSTATLKTRVNGELRQDGLVRDMVHDIPAIVEYASSVWTLLPGDVILTGTPGGIGPLTDGDVVEIEISGIGTLSNPVRSAGRA
jgi:2-keto-4-pentenoate hydratase/2-oxohepta-3-ene-1,7-dioic acid hydratase in catechol pathway